MAYPGWLYELTIILYAFSLLGYFIDFLQRNQKVNRLAFSLLAFVLLLQTGLFLAELVRSEEFPILTPSDGLFFYAWVLLVLSLVINSFFRVDFFVFLTNVFGFFMMAIYLFAPRSEVPARLAEQLSSGLLVIHVVLAFLAYGAFTLSFILAMMYLFQFRMLKKKRWSRLLRRFGSLVRAEKFSLFFVALGIPLLLMSLILGLIWSAVAFGEVIWFDAKVILSFVVLAVYSIFLYFKWTGKFHGEQWVVCNAAGFLVILMNYFLSESLQTFHWWGT